MVAAGHEAFGSALLDREFKAGQIQFPQGAFVQHSVYGHTAKLLAVYREMFGTGIDAFALDAARIARRHLSGQIGGSSEKYSKFPPDKGLRLMFSPGPSAT